jgi:diamine N-acetyltransferase
MTNSNKSVRLRALEPDDIDAIYRWENDPSVWTHSAAHQPFSRQTLQRFIDESSATDIYSSRQLRLMAVNNEGTAVGCADLFDFDPYHRRAGVGVLIDSRLRNNGYGKAMLRELGQFAATHLQLHLLYCDIADNNIASIRLFESEGFQRCGTRPGWLWCDNEWHAAHIYQKVLEPPTTT